MPPETPLLAVILLVAAFTQGATGFGFGLVIMAVLPHVLGIRQAVPVVAVFGLFVCETVLWGWRHSLRLGEVGPILLGEVVGTPVGVFFLTSVEPRLVTATLGLVLVAWGGGHLALELLSARRRTERRPRRLPHRAWGVPAGLLAGMIGGAFNTGGPPVIVYATARRWEPGTFQANLQVVFLFNTVLQLVLLASRGLVTREVLTLDLVGLPILLVGVGAGTVAARRIPARAFRRVVLALLVVFGLVLLVRSLGAA